MGLSTKVLGRASETFTLIIITKLPEPHFKDNMDSRIEDDLKWKTHTFRYTSDHTVICNHALLVGVITYRELNEERQVASTI